mmetsp:Transcript_79302/g.201858  ORF Transcript_79302/g.201858 Transcript_79302/m.201858 type:complete len:557 (+) Transcript_79302:184-1854(+)
MRYPTCPTPCFLRASSEGCGRRCHAQALGLGLGCPDRLAQQQHLPRLRKPGLRTLPTEAGQGSFQEHDSLRELLAAALPIGARPCCRRARTQGVKVPGGVGREVSAGGRGLKRPEVGVQDVQKGEEPAYQLAQQAAVGRHESRRDQVVELGGELLPQQRLRGHCIGLPAELGAALRHRSQQLVHESVGLGRRCLQGLELGQCATPVHDSLLQPQGRHREAVVGVRLLHGRVVLLEHLLERREALALGDDLRQALALLLGEHVLRHHPQLLQVPEEEAGHRHVRIHLRPLHRLLVLLLQVRLQLRHAHLQGRVPLLVEALEGLSQILDARVVSSFQPSQQCLLEAGLRMQPAGREGAGQLHDPSLQLLPAQALARLLLCSLRRLRAQASQLFRQQGEKLIKLAALKATPHHRQRTCQALCQLHAAVVSQTRCARVGECLSNHRRVASGQSLLKLGVCICAALCGRSCGLVASGKGRSGSLCDDRCGCCGPRLLGSSHCCCNLRFNFLLGGLLCSDLRCGGLLLRCLLRNCLGFLLACGLLGNGLGLVDLWHSSRRGP